MKMLRRPKQLLALVVSICGATRDVTGFSPCRKSASVELSTKLSAASPNSGRRTFVKSAVLVGAASFFGHGSFSAPNDALAFSEEEKMQDVYFGVGCFWHSQHSFVEAERDLLKRSDEQLTSRTGYAGGRRTDKEGRVCYHNLQGIADYGKLGHGEVVGLTIPESSIGDFAVAYFDQFTPKGERVDPMDRGGEYRSLLGLPGGVNHPRYPEVEAAATAKGLTLKKGDGNDPDTLGKKLVYVMDTRDFPFYQAEVYHQFHDDFLTPPYGKEYNDLVKPAFEADRVKDTGCPDRFPV